MDLDNKKLTLILEQHNLWQRTLSIDGEVASKGKQMTLDKATITDVYIVNQDFSDSIIVNGSITNTTFENCDFSRSTFLSNVIESSNFLNCHFVKADMRSMQSNFTSFIGSDFTRADLTQAAFKNSKLGNCTLSWSWIVGTEFDGVDFESVELEEARIIDAKFYNIKRFPQLRFKNLEVQNISIARDDQERRLSDEDAIIWLHQQQNSA